MSDRVTGIFTERDLLKRVVATKQDPDETEIQEVMSCPVVTIPADCTVSNASKLLEKMKIRRLVVMDDKKLCGVITQTDILRAINGRLQKEELSYHGLLSESGYCFYTTDLDFNTTSVNSEFMELLEIDDPNEVVGKPFLPERFWDDPQQRDRLLEQMDRTSVEINELTLQTAGGRRLYVILFIMPIKNLTGEVSGSHGILYDITAKK
jgi:PAS domain S-box-containing protein